MLAQQEFNHLSYLSSVKSNFLLILKIFICINACLQVYMCSLGCLVPKRQEESIRSSGTGDINDYGSLCGY